MTRVLVVDDSSFARNMVRRTLEGNGFEVIPADSGSAALELVKSSTFDIATLDLLMPDMSGQETLTELKKICPNMKVIIITADIQMATQQELMGLGASAFLNKPFQAATLLDTIQTFLGKG
jgi:two-component system, chemotaxis family, chemotaxis protein CheY